MLKTTEDGTVRVHLSPANPGQFLACCGLLEVADRQWGGAEGWFEAEGTRFCMRRLTASPARGPAPVVEALAAVSVTNAMTDAELRRRSEIAAMPKREREADPALADEKKRLDAMWREASVRLGSPLHLQVDWFQDDRAGGSVFKTWAGQQSVLDIARGLQLELRRVEWDRVPCSDWLAAAEGTGTCTFNFDSDIGGSGADKDIGFSLDPLGMRVLSKPLTEFAAFIGMQRFRPATATGENRHRYATWACPLPPSVASTAANGALDGSRSRLFEFRLLYRTKYLKSFLPAQPVTR